MATNPNAIFSAALANGPHVEPFDVGQWMDTRALRQAQAGNLQAEAGVNAQQAQAIGLANQKTQIEMQGDQALRDAIQHNTQMVPVGAPSSTFPAPPSLGTDAQGNPIPDPNYHAAMAASVPQAALPDVNGIVREMNAKGHGDRALTYLQSYENARATQVKTLQDNLKLDETRNAAIGERVEGLLSVAKPKGADGPVDPDGLAQAQAAYPALAAELNDKYNAGLPQQFDLGALDAHYRMRVGHDQVLKDQQAALNLPKTEAETNLSTAQAKLTGEQAETAALQRKAFENYVAHPETGSNEIDAMAGNDPDLAPMAAAAKVRYEGAMRRMSWTEASQALQDFQQQVGKVQEQRLTNKLEVKKATDLIPAEVSKARQVGKASALGQMDAIESMPSSPIAQAVAEYRTAPPSPRSLTTPAGQAFMAEVLKVNPSYDSTNYQNRQKTRIAYTTGAQGQQGIQLNTMIGHVDDALDAAAAMNNGSFTPANSLYNKVRTTFGDDAVTNFDTFKTAVAGETAKVLKGVATNAEVESVEKNIGSASSPKQLQTALKDTMRIAGSKLRGLEYNYSQAFPEDKTFSILSPESKSTLTKRGFDPATMKPAAAALPAGAGKVIDKATAKQFYNAAGGDPTKARQLAQQNGWKLQ